MPPLQAIESAVAAAVLEATETTRQVTKADVEAMQAAQQAAADTQVFLDCHFLPDLLLAGPCKLFAIAK